MTPIDWTALMLGGAVGAAVSALFFIGLALGMRRALRAHSPVALLALSALIRIALLLAVGWAVTVQAGPWAALGYAAAFLAARIAATTAARIGAAP
ncbi:ATP synthase subunit AtpR [Roseovarius sp. S4756]|uniref:ATP synthase subunit AtpR n=1 Tax=Roseovarius maritimus TaxID=3342637 RepID=UPI00372A989D